jgi:hypothetical protein
MDHLLQLWLNPINLGVLFLCLCTGLWILSRCAPNYKDK